MTEQPVNTIAIQHPKAALLAETGRGVVGTYLDVISGDWSAIADLCAHENAGGKIVDVENARQILAGAAAETGYVFIKRDDVAEEISATLDSDGYVIRAREGMALTALDLFMRLMCGQWSEADFVACLAAQATTRAESWDPYSLNSLRQQVATSRNSMVDGTYRPLAPHEFPDHPQASIGIAESVLPAKIAYHAYKMLGGGAPGGPTFAVPDGPVVVAVDGRPVNRIRDYV